MKRIFIYILCLINFSVAYGQVTVKGIVKTTEANGETVLLPGASIYWSGTSIATTTNSSGRFELKLSEILPAKLVISFVGYVSDTLLITEATEITVSLKPTIELKEAVVEKRLHATMISTLKPLNTTEITEKELLKAACCNLSESFETNPSVNVNYTDAVTGIKEIQMLGLQGIYTQLLTENIPALRGLAAPYGLTYIPGPWMQSIQITKGAGTVVNGFESLTGSINVEFKKPEEIDHRYHINLYAGDAGRFEANLYGVKKFSEKWSSMLMLHGSMVQREMDNNDDSFMDQPLVKQVNIYSRWRYHSGEKLEGQFGFKFISEQRDGGQTAFDKSNDYGTTNHYGMQINTKRAELYTKTGLVYYDKPNKSMGIQSDWVFHDVKSFIGLRNYNATQKSGYINYIFQNEINSCDHKFKTGASILIDDFNEVYDDPFSKYQRNITYIVPGIFGEYIYNPDDKFTLIAGMRLDYSNEYSWFYTPRLHAKLNLTENAVVRVSAGKSYRTANVIADNFGMLASSRILMIEENLDQEEGYNYGANFTYKFKMNQREATFSFDLYRTDFVNQIVVDAVSIDSLIQIYNLHGQSFAQSVAVSLDYEIIDNLTVRLAYKFDDVNVTFQKGLQEKPLIARNKALFNIAYAFANEKWRIDFTTQWNGKKKLVYQSYGLPETNDKKYSPDFFIINTQVTKVFRKFELYAGGENITNYMQDDPIISAQNPFDKSFDATQIWGPIMGARVYVGFRMNIQ